MNSYDPDIIEESFVKLKNYAEQNNFKGWDLFDGLNSKLLKNTFLYKNSLVRLFVIQLFKRSPVNLRKLAKIEKDYNPKGLALFASGFINIGEKDKAEYLLKKLLDLRSQNYGHMSWGYNFDWQARAFYVPEGKPNIVTSVFAANAFLDYFDKYGENNELNCLDIAVKCCEFIIDNLIIHESERSLCFGYIPGESARVHNANMLGVSLMGRVYSHTREKKYYLISKKAMKYSADRIKNNYSWEYGERPHHRFTDNFHTGFNLVAMKEWMDMTGDYEWDFLLEKAYEYFLDTFWQDNGCPKYYNNSLYPIDIHCSAQGIVTCFKLMDYSKKSFDLLQNITAWAVNNFQDKKGYFYYQQNKFYTNKIPYIRWAQAWMFYALSFLLQEKRG